MTSRTSEQSPRFGESLERPLVRREDQIVGPLFSLGVSLAGTFLGEDSCLQRRMGSDDDLRNGTLTLGRSVEHRGSLNRLPRFRIRACSGIVQSQEAQFADSLLGRIERRTLLFVSSLPVASFVSSGSNAVGRFLVGNRVGNEVGNCGL